MSELALRHVRLSRASSGLLLIAAVVFVELSAAEVRAAENERAWTPELQMQVKSVDNVQVSPDGGRVVFTVGEAVMQGDKSEQLTHIHLAGADGKDVRQLTHGDKSCDAPQWSPDGRWIAFLSTRIGKKNLWLIPVDGGEAQQLTETKGGVSSFKWSPDGRSVAFVALDPPTPEEEKGIKEKNDARVVDERVKMNHLYVVPVELPLRNKPTARQLTKGNYSIDSAGLRTGRPTFDWSPDGKAIVFTHTLTPSPDDWPTADISVVELASGAVRPLVGSKAAESSPIYSPDGRWIAYVASDDPPGWAGAGRVHVVPTSSESPRALADTFDGFSRYSHLIGWSADSSRLYFTELRGTVVTVNALPLEGKPVQIGMLAGMSPSVHLNATRRKFGLRSEALDRPQEAFVTDVERFQPVQVSRVHADRSDVPLGRTEVVRWKSTDGLEIEGLLTYPVGYEKGKRYPLLLVIHGGPMGAFSQTYIGAPGPYPLAAFASRGYAILRANVRGSSGYGVKFRYANRGDWGGMDYQDLMAGVDHVVALGVADPERLGVMGWSYGGFMTSWVITQTKRFKAASVGAGVTNLVSFTGTADIPGFLPDYFGAEFWDNLETYRAHSPMFQVKGVSTPTLIQHGERDERVPLSQGQELYNSLKRQRCTVKMVVYPRTPHGISEPRLMLDAMNRNLEWFETYVGRGSTASPSR